MAMTSPATESVPVSTIWTSTFTCTGSSQTGNAWSGGRFPTIESTASAPANSPTKDSYEEMEFDFNATE